MLPFLVDILAVFRKALYAVPAFLSLFKYTMIRPKWKAGRKRRKREGKSAKGGENVI